MLKQTLKQDRKEIDRIEPDQHQPAPVVRPHVESPSDPRWRLVFHGSLY
jgi:hypothetical protein